MNDDTNGKGDSNDPSWEEIARHLEAGDSAYKKFLPSLEKLAKAIKNGSLVAEKLYYLKVSATLGAILKRHYGGRNFVLDILQETLIQSLIALRNGRIKDMDKTANYIRSMAFNIAKKFLKDDYKHGKHVDLDSFKHLSGLSNDPMKNYEEEDVLRFAHETLQELPTERDRQILKLYYYEGLDKPEICEKLKLTAQHFDRVLHRARKRLIKKMAEKDDDAANRASKALEENRDKIKDDDKKG